MRFVSLRTLLALSLSLLLASAAFGDVTLVDHGKAQAVIVVDGAVMKPDIAVPAVPTAAHEVELQRQRLRESVNDLALYLQKMSGAKIEIVTPTGEYHGQDGGAVPIFIGEAATRNKLGGKSLKTYPFKQGFRVDVSKHQIVLTGESDLATSYAIYEILDRLGCRWYIPGDLGEVVPSTTTIKLKEGSEDLAPGTIFRGVWYADDAFRRRNRMGGIGINAGQVLETYITPEQRKQHPDWQATDANGKPIGTRLKWSSPTLADAIADKINADLDKDPVYSVSLAPEDGADFDDSPADRALDTGDIETSMMTPSLTDRLMVFSNRITARVVAKHPGVMMGQLAYVQFTRPPTKQEVNPNLIPQIAPITFSRIGPMSDDTVPGNKELRYIVEGWGKKASATSYYAFGYHLAEVSAPYPMIARWGFDVPFILAHNCKYWQPETTTSYETSMQALYMGNRLAWNPALKPADIIRELNDKFYGHASREMGAYWQYIDDLWTKTPAYAGCGWDYQHRFTPKAMAEARRLMEAAVNAAQTPEEKARVELANESLGLLEKFMKLREDLSGGHLADLHAQSEVWQKLVSDLGDKYEKNFCFTKTGWAPKTVAGNYFRAFYAPEYDDASRIAKEFDILTPGAMRSWRWQYNKESPGSEASFASPGFDDSKWKTTDPGIDTWADLGHVYAMGSMWYRTQATLPPAAAAPGKKTYLWVSNTDGSAKVFVNGKHVPYVKAELGKDGKPTGKTQTLDAADGYCTPFSFDISEAIKPGENQITILGTRTTNINELGTGGLLGPVVVYREK